MAMVTVPRVKRNTTEATEGSDYGFVCRTRVVKQAGDESAVTEDGVRGRDVFEVALLEHRVLKHHRLHLQIEEPAGVILLYSRTSCQHTVPRGTLRICTLQRQFIVTISNKMAAADCNI